MSALDGLIARAVLMTADDLYRMSGRGLFIGAEVPAFTDTRLAIRLAELDATTAEVDECVRLRLFSSAGNAWRVWNLFGTAAAA